MPQVLFRVIPQNVKEASEALEKILFSGVEGILKPTQVDWRAYARTSDSGEAKMVVVADPLSDVPDIVDADQQAPKICEHRISAEYSTEHFPLLAILDPESEMVPEPAERMDIALHLLETMTIAHGLSLYHGQLNSERIFVHSEDPICYVFDFFVGEYFNPYICPRDYRGPESIIRSEASTPEKVDVWALGCVLYEILTTEALFTLPSSKDDVGVTVPMLIRRQIMNIIETISDFPNHSAGSGDAKNANDFARGVGTFESKYTELFDVVGTAHAADICDARDSARTQAKKARFADGTILEPYVWAIQQCLTFNPDARPSLKEIREGLLERLGRADEIDRSALAIEQAKARIADKHASLISIIGDSENQAKAIDGNIFRHIVLEARK
eukprot:GILI01005329.1.p1 GENE.GILI01005329.1~~GILI01005329.1.p1  ORF type:complete len:386 (+),score=67.41 GILI01005329.1:568-1725(+)